LTNSSFARKSALGSAIRSVDFPLAAGSRWSVADGRDSGLQPLFVITHQTYGAADAGLTAMN
jgi:hypothetical protein